MDFMGTYIFLDRKENVKVFNFVLLIDGNNGGNHTISVARRF